MTLIQTPQTSASPALPSTLRLGAVHLTVVDLDRSVAWYQRSLGLRVQHHDNVRAGLGDGQETVVVLHEDAAARRASGYAGLYHYALLLPTREALARAAVRLAGTRTPIQGASDHRTHEAIYLADADGNGIELAWDRDRELWPATPGRPAPLDFDSLLATVNGGPVGGVVGEGLRVGHLHLHVGDIKSGLGFYRDTIGFELKGDWGTAAFVSAGGYHHHLAFNVWNGRDVHGSPPHTVGLRRWTVELPAAADVADLRERVERGGHPVTALDGGFEVRDPWGNAMAVVSARTV
jgi:catechol 2,3-dioxygenase